MSAWQAFKDDLTHPPTPEAFKAAWKKFSGKDAPDDAVAAFGGRVVTLFCEASQELGVLIDLAATNYRDNSVYGWETRQYGFDVHVETETIERCEL